jgi:hypothetical protein
MIATATQLGIGIYTPAEAAFYARVRTQTLNRWIFGDSHGDAVISAQIKGGDEKTVTFLDFVQALAIRAIRTQYPKISLQKIRKAVDLAGEKLGIDYPFAREHKTFIYDGREITLEIKGNLVALSGKFSKNLLFGPIAELYSQRLTFGTDGLASDFCAWGIGDCCIRMDPKRRFGEPVVISSGYTAHALWEASIIEGGIAAAARAYGVEERDVILACDYYDHLSVAA